MIGSLPLAFVAGSLEVNLEAPVYLETGSGTILLAYFHGWEDPDRIDVSAGSLVWSLQESGQDREDVAAFTNLLVSVIAHESIHWALRWDGTATNQPADDEEEAWVHWIIERIS